jgi:hypothetical protein
MRSANDVPFHYWPLAATKLENLKFLFGTRSQGAAAPSPQVNMSTSSTYLRDVSKFGRKFDIWGQYVDNVDTSVDRLLERSLR